ncbi:MAG: phytanoyl-CoA dioxygenase family protein [Terriglobia bacterium]|jgi:ectoine hydroxylase-related dioxygenase (phytanoyl-CoA dioxygenase family)
MCAYRITEQGLKRFEDDGFLIVRNLFDAEEMALLRQAVEVDKDLAEAEYAVKDRQGGTAKIAIWQGTGDDLYGLVARSERIVNTMERLLGGEVYHWHSKMTIKVPLEGGAWEWHQDYGYWYTYGCLYPYLATCMIAVDRATEENGCLQVLRGSHKFGRIDHDFQNQLGADPERLQEAVKTLETVYCQLEIGDGIFFHCNLLHCSGQNKSPNPRRAFLCCYNAARNSPYKVVRHPQYTPLAKVPDSALKDAGLRIGKQEYSKHTHAQVVK